MNVSNIDIIMRWSHYHEVVSVKYQCLGQLVYVHIHIHPDKLLVWGMGGRKERGEGDVNVKVRL